MEIFLGAFESDWEQRRAAMLHERLLGRGKPVDEEERRRRGGAVSTGSSLFGKNGTDNGLRWSFGRTAGGRRPSLAEPSMRSRFQSLASGSQPAVVKMASFGGGSRLGAMINYVARNGDVVVENERGEELRGRDQLSSIGGEWDHLMKNRAESRDIGTFSLDMDASSTSEADPYGVARVLLKRGLGDRSFAFGISRRNDGAGFRAEGVAVLRDRSGERLTGDSKASGFVQARIDAESDGAEGRGTFRFSDHGNGTDYGTSRLRDLVERHDGAVQNDRGEAIADAKQAGDLVQLEWRDQLHSRKPRDVMHLVISARAGTDVQAFRAAARDFLAHEFAGHRYVFSLHDPAHDPKAEEVGGKRPHVHVHAIVAMRSETGGRVETTIQSFRRWRVTMAENARDHGIRMEMTDRRERASAPAYTRNQVRPTSRWGRTEHEGTSEASHRRYRNKRADQENVARTQGSANYTRHAIEHWREIAAQDAGSAASKFAYLQIKRLESALSLEAEKIADASVGVKSHSQFITHLVTLQKIVSEDEQMRHMSRSEFEAYEKRVETALFQAERAMPKEERANFDEIATAARDHVNVRRELMELSEQQAQGEQERDLPQLERDDDPSARWNDAVQRHGLRTVEAANQIMLEVERYREEIERADVREITADKAALQEKLNRELTRAGELGAAGNTLIREIAEVDEELKLAIETAEQSRERRPKVHESTGVSVGLKQEGENDRSNTAPDADRTFQPDEMQANQAEGRRANAAARIGDTTRTDPAQQHVPRLDQLQREADERHERDHEDRDR